MFTDIEGYTALMQENEQKAVQIRNKHRQIFNSITDKYRGKVLQYYGDGTLSIFDSAIEAVKCAIEMQLGFQENPAIPVRIGIHTGDIIVSDEEIIGDGVNIAARIEALAVSGSVFISEKVYDEVKNQESIKTSLLKAFKLKNVLNPVKVFAIANEGLIVPKPDDIGGIENIGKSDIAKGQPHQKMAGRTKAIFGIIGIVTLAALIVFYLKYLPSMTASAEAPLQSIAILAFENMSGDPDQEYFSDGISEEILNSIVNVKGLKVAGRTSSFSFKDKNVDIRSIGEELNVELVLEGSVRKFGNNVVITAQLIKVEDGFHLWSETYERDLEDIFSVQKDIAARIVEKLKLQLQMSDEGFGGTLNLEAYDLFLKGIYFHSKDFLSAEKAMDAFQRAVELDANYAEAHALIAEMYIVYAGYGLMPPVEAYTRARAAAQKAISINEREPRAHKALAYVYFTSDWNWEAALAYYNQAVDYGLPVPDQFITYYDIFVNKDYDHAIKTSEEMAAIDPLNIESHWHLGLMNFFSGRFDDAMKAFNTTLELDPNYSEGHHWKGAILGYQGKYDEAIESLQKALELTQGQGPANLDLLIVKIQMGNKEEVLLTLNEWEKSTEPINPMDPAMLYALLDMPDKAIYWLEESYRQRAIMTVSLKFYWIWDSIRDDPRFIEIYDRMNFPD